jgi:hypothetical protein
MKKFLSAIIGLALVGASAQIAHAISMSNAYKETVTSNANGTTTYTYTTTNLDSLEHGYFYTWGITSPGLPAKDTVLSASLTLNAIYDWEVDDPGNILYVDLLRNPKHNINSGSDNNSTKNHFSGKGVYLGSWSDTDGPITKNNVTFDFTSSELAALDKDLAGATFGFGLDPHCHFYDSNVTFSFVEGDPSVPEPATILLFGAGLAGLAGFRLRRKKESL